MGIPVRCPTRAAMSTPIVPVILGNSNLGSLIALEATRRGHRVIITSRSKTDHLVSKNLHYIHTPQKAFWNQSFWHDLIKNHIHPNEHVMLVNTIGASVIEKGFKPEQVNIEYPLTAIRGITQALTGRSFNVVHLSSIVADGIEADYGRTKRIMEEALEKLPIDDLMIFRLGGVVSPAIKGFATQFIKAHKRLSPEEMGLFPFSFVISDTVDQVKAPIVAGSDMAIGVLNSFQFPGRHRINGVNAETLTLEHILRFYRGLYNRKFRPIYLPTKAAQQIVQHFSFGHFNPYTVELCSQGGRSYSHIPFQTIVGNSLKTLEEIYQLGPHDKLMVARPPLLSFAKEIAQIYWNNPNARRDFNQAIKKTAYAWLTRSHITRSQVPLKIVTESKFNAKVSNNRAHRQST